MTEIIDDEFGRIILRRLATTTHIRARITPSGHLTISHPPFVPRAALTRFIHSSRDELRRLFRDTIQPTIYRNGMSVGKSHTIIVRSITARYAHVTMDGQQIIVSLPTTTDIAEPTIQRDIRDVVIKALRVEAKRYLPRRLAFVADKTGYHYSRVRFSHASSRWGSCSSTGTISLNIALMRLPHELIDYVIIHELTHTVHMNHSQDFWSAVELYDPHYKLHRRQLKRESPSV